MKNKIGIGRNTGEEEYWNWKRWVKNKIGIGRNMVVEEDWDWQEYG